jgi:cell wall-associated NlpC family hydrolase
MHVTKKLTSHRNIAERIMQRPIRPLLFLRNIICIVSCAGIVLSSFPASATESQDVSSFPSVGFSERQFEDEVKKYLGIPYRSGGTTKRGMDCSGFARIVYDRLLGIDLPHNSINQFRFAELEKVPSSDMQTGDLIFFGNNKKKRINHVGVYLSDGQFIHASSSQGITVSSLEDRYWKKRLVGSRRHMALSSSQDTDELVLESHLEIPVGQDGTITACTRDEFRTNSLVSQNYLNSFDQYSSSKIFGLNHTPLNFYEIGYGQTISDGLTVSMSGIYEKFDNHTAWSGFGLSSQYMSYASVDSSTDISVRQGLKLASDFRPSSWLSITPSVTFFDYSSESGVLYDTPKRTLGLNTLLSPMHNRWSLTMLLQYSDQEYPDNVATYDNNIFGSLDMAVKLGINLTDNVQFSIMGTHDNRTAAYNLPEDTSFIQSDGSSNLFFSIDLKY